MKNNVKTKIATIAVTALMSVSAFSGNLLFSSESYFSNNNTITAFAASTGYHVVTAETSLTIRAGAGTSYKAVGYIPGGTTVNITQVSGNWGKLTYKGVTGWSSFTYLSPTSQQVNKKYKVTATSLRIRSGAGTSYTTLGYIPNGAVVTVTTISGNWAKLTYNGITGWSSLDYLTPYDEDIITGYVCPVQGTYIITDEYDANGSRGRVHKGIDISYSNASLSHITNKSTRNIVSVADGTVVKVLNNCSHQKNASCTCNKGTGFGGYGNCVLIKHKDGKYSFYAHLMKNSISVKEGQSVKRGAVIAKMGNSGSVSGTTGIHLHFEIRSGNYPTVAYSSLKHYNPRNYIKF